MNERIKDIYEKYSHKFSSHELKPNTLYIVSTPIGNIEDVSFRAINVLKNCDLIASEDTRNTNFLLQQYGIKNRTMSYYSHVESGKADHVISEIGSGKSVALVSDAGTPCISDPGNILVAKCIENGIDIVSVPGCSSLIHSLILSGFSSKKFYFQGFLPQKKGRRTLLEELSSVKMPLIIFESPFRIYKTMKDILEHFGNKEITISRELTKKFEQVVRGKVKTLIERDIKTKGEFVIIINNY
ncbi:MAG TPA: 16S rRNA (cytidine(1402)-2'-O)-methyltransferase [Ignavibacteria bacterium]|nr:16S rRNA (cytidine(1402)-2'-O)-methyltransferase [Ignavibacteria bacterium]HMR40178.1 16S rRNA (cytidine(1402)-2'-O)-methyltransferase [Ignavibacteria bacterium]